MKILPFNIPKPNDDALVYQEDSEVIFYNKLHQHEEIQLSYIAKGAGSLILGDTINTYKQGDILVIGSNIPHVFRSEKSHQKSLMQSLFFTKDSFGSIFFDIQELRHLDTFFTRSAYGFKALSDKQSLQVYFNQLKKATKFERFILLLKILNILTHSKHQPLSSYIYKKQYSDDEGRRMNAIMEFTMNNYKNEILLYDIASVANMTKNAFCKYFKKRTNKTYVQFLTELRIENVCKQLLTNNDVSISELAENNGFNNISNFNRQFKNLKQLTPLAYRKSV